MAPLAEGVPHLLHGNGALPSIQSTSDPHQGLASSGRVSTPSLASPGDSPRSLEKLRQALENERLEETRDVYKVMRTATMSPPPQRYVDFEELWKQSVDAALGVSSAGRAENDQTDPAVTGVQRSGGCWGTRVECGVRIGPQDEYDDTERVGGDLPVHFARHISDTAAVCYHNLLQQGIRTLTFVGVVHVLGAWHEEKIYV